jgi:lipoyl(octanoyl) transferase
MTTVRESCRRLPFVLSDGPGNMASDETLLVSATDGTASLRLYGWTLATLSLGYFQAAALRQADPLLATLPFVRRCTGGETLVHHHELTYALALPSGPKWQPRNRPWLCRMHGIIAAALAALGVSVRISCGGEDKKLGDVLCFLHQTPGDVLCREAKIVGSAQRKQRGALLQHGAILLAQSPHTPGLPGLRELAGFDPGKGEQLPATLLHAFSQDTGWQLEPSDWTESERAQATEWAEAKYRRASWNLKR